MDMERIKQNFRLRSGRAKKSKKAPVQPIAPSENKTIPGRPQTAPQAQHTLSAQVRDDSPSLRNWDRSTALPQLGLVNGTAPRPKPEPKSSFQQQQQPPRPNGPNSTSKINREQVDRKQSTHYGRSGIERPPPATLSKMASPNPPSSSDEQDFDLKPPPSKPKPTSIDTLTEMLFSEGHLHVLIHDPRLFSRFTGFLSRYRPALSPVVLQYLEYQKAIKAIEYANAVAESIKPLPLSNESIDGSQTPTQAQTQTPPPAAQLSETFAKSSKEAYDKLLSAALPAYVTYTLVKLATECLVAEISNHHPTPLTRNLLGGLSEVFCLSDPTQPDNPLIYCSEEFYRLTGYASGDVLGQNCRFLQGPKTDRGAVGRIREAVAQGEQVTETLLNYRRDGRGFVNVLLLAPLEDDQGKVKYFLGAQVDASRLVAGGWGLEGLEKLIQKREVEELRRGRKGRRGEDGDQRSRALKKLGELSEMFDLEESAVVRRNSRSRSVSLSLSGDESGSDRPRRERRVLRDDGENNWSEDEEDEEERTGAVGKEGATEKEKSAWKLAQSGSSGKLPGVYQSYMLIRPAPSLRILFMSPALRKMGKISQSPFMSHLAAPAQTLAGLKESFQAGVPVSAKVAFMPEAGANRYGIETGRWRRGNKSDDTPNADTDPAKMGRTCWISATPLLGGDDEIGVWMVVLIDRASVASASGKTLSKTGEEKNKGHQQLEGRSMNVAKAADNKGEPSPLPMLSGDVRKEDIPIKPKRVGGTRSANNTPKRAASPPPEMEKQQDSSGEPETYQEVPKASGEQLPGWSAAEAEAGEAQAAEDFAQSKFSMNHEDENHVEQDGDEEEKHNNEKRDDVDQDQDRERDPYQDRDQDQDYSDNDNDNDDDVFANSPDDRPTMSHRTPTRVLIRNNSDLDVEAGKEANVDTAAGGSFPGGDELEADKEATPTRAHHHANDDSDNNDDDEGARKETAHSSLHPPLRMDYLTHPGTRKERAARRHRSGGENGTATPSDPDCDVWSPYSVD